MAIQKSRLLTAVFIALLAFPFCVSLSAQAADRPNRSTSSDVSAGQFIDSMLGPDAPHAKQQPQRRAKPQPQQRVVQRHSTLRGKLVENPNIEDGSPPFALVDRYGGILRYIEPSKSVDLQAHVGKTIGVRRDTGDILLASQLALPRKSKTNTNVQLAQHIEPVPAGEPTPADEPLPAGAPVDESSIVNQAPTDGSYIDEGYIEGGYENGPIYLEGEYDEGLAFEGGCPTCGSGHCNQRGGGCGYGARGVLYAHAEYLLWDFDGMNTPPLVLSDDDPNFNESAAAETGADPAIIFGNGQVLEDTRNGFRITLGYWIDDYGQWGLEGDYLYFDDITESFTAGTKDGAAPIGTGPFIGRPFFNTVATATAPRGTAQEDVDTNRLDGTVTVALRSEFQSAGLRLRHNLCCRPGCNTCCGDAVECGVGVGCGTEVFAPYGPLGRLATLLRKGTRQHDVLYGVRWASLNDSLRVDEDLQELQTATPPLSSFTVFDAFETDNDFFGGEIGYETNWEHRRWSLNFLSKVAIGNTRQTARINGGTTITPTPVIASTVTGGLLAQRFVLPDGTVVGNIGTYERDEFSVIPEIGLTLGYNLTRRLKLTAGYTLLYWSNVLRAGDLVDIDVNGNLLARNGPPAANTVGSRDHPRFAFIQTDLLAQGLNLGAEYTW